MDYLPQTYAIVPAHVDDPHLYRYSLLLFQPEFKLTMSPTSTTE